MTFHADKARQTRYNRTDFKRDPDWYKASTSRIWKVWFACLLPFALSLAVLIASCAQHVAWLETVLFTMIAFFIPGIICYSVAALTWKRQKRVCMAEAAGRYDDALLLAEHKLVYTFRNYRDEIPNPQYQVEIPYSQISRLEIRQPREMLLLSAGGSYTALGQKREVLSQVVYDPQQPIRLEIPMLYTDNQRIIDLLQEYSGRCAVVSQNARLDD